MAINLNGDILKTQLQFLTDVNSNLEAVVDMAAIDFVAVNMVLKKYHSNIPAYHIKGESVPFSVMSKIETMMSGLQYMDVFNQRVNHLIQTHQKMMTSTIASNYKESFFCLHVFQAMTIEMDLFSAISTIRIVLSELQDHLNAGGKIVLSAEGYFCHTTEIRKTLQQTINNLRQAGGDLKLLPLPPLMPDQIRLLNSFYTMERERVVLDWFLSSMPSGTWEELLQYYERAISRIAINDVELF